MTELELSRLATLAEAIVATPALSDELLQISDLVEGTDAWKAAKAIAMFANLPDRSPATTATFVAKLKADKSEPKRIAGALVEWASENVARRRRLVSVLG